MVCGTYVASQSIMFERGCLLPNIEVLYMNSPIPPCRRKCTAAMPLLAYVSFYKNIRKKGVINAYLQTLLVDLSPQ